MTRRIQQHSTTILAVRHGSMIAIGGDGQVTHGQTILKQDVQKIRKLLNDEVLVGFAGSTADAFALLERFEARAKEYPGNIPRAATELARDWRTDRALRRLEAMLIVVSADHILLITGQGDVIRPTDGIIGIGSGGPFAMAAAKALVRHSELPAREIVAASLKIASEIDVYTNENLVIEELPVSELTPKEVVARLDEHIVGQTDAKRAVAIALRNRWRWKQLPEELRREVTPKNIIMIGPTGVGKTEITRRLAHLTGAPFIKVEATKYTEVGYYGRDVESIIRDVVEAAIQIVKSRKREEVLPRAKARVEERLLDLLVPAEKGWNAPGDADAEARHQRTREKLREMLAAKELEQREVELRIEQRHVPVQVFSNLGMDQMDINFQDMFERIMPRQTSQRKLTVAEARGVLLEQEAEALMDRDAIHEEAIKLAEESGIVFIDEIDKIAGESEGSKHADVSRQGVQRDLLPIVEGTTVQTRYGNVTTDNMLFIAAGAFHRARPSDLMPELQGRFPIRVELQDLTRDDFVRILTEPTSSLTLQYTALLQTEGMTVKFQRDGLEAVADIAWKLNQSTQNIGARRLHTVLERLLEELSFEGPDLAGKTITIDRAYVEKKLAAATQTEDLSKFIL